MQVPSRLWGAMHFRVDGPADGIPVVFAAAPGPGPRPRHAVLPSLPGICAIRSGGSRQWLSSRTAAARGTGLSEITAAPPDQASATAGPTRSAGSHLIADAGPLPCIEAPEDWAAIFAPFAQEYAR